MAAEHWNGKQWALDQIPYSDPQAGITDELTGVSCLVSGFCAAVGWHDVGICGAEESDFTVPLGGFFAQHGWSLKRLTDIPCLPDGTILPDRDLSAVACRSQHVCTAVGRTNTGIPFSPSGAQLVERWNGVAWQVEPTPLRDGGELTSVACVSQVDCTAVGAVTSGEGDGAESVNLVERRHAGRWSIERAPLPTRARFGQLNGVACPSSVACIAVGMSENSITDTGPHAPLVESTIPQAGRG